MMLFQEKDSSAVPDYIAPVAPVITAVDCQQIIANLMDFKVDLKLEIQRMNQKLTKLDDHMGDVMTRMNHMQRSVSQPVSVRPSSDDPLQRSTQRLRDKERLVITSQDSIISDLAEESKPFLPKVATDQE
ncbi:unnamed protein product, partial [Meganyctiphanes norvegica]